jgi:hypothetical protein
MANDKCEEGALMSDEGQLSGAEFRVQLQSIFNLAALVRGLRIREVLEQFEQAESLGPILDPTAYVKTAESRRWQEEVVRAAYEFQQVVEKVVAKEE